MVSHYKIEEAQELGKEWGRNAVKVHGLAGTTTLTCEDALNAVGEIVFKLISAVADLSLERGEAFAQAFEAAARQEINRHIVRSGSRLH